MIDLIESGISNAHLFTCSSTDGSGSGALKLEALERIVIDGSYIDQKKRGIFDIKEVHFPLLQLLTRPELRERYGAEKNGVKILVF